MSSRAASSGGTATPASRLPRSFRQPPASERSATARTRRVARRVITATITSGRRGATRLQAEARHRDQGGDREAQDHEGDQEAERARVDPGGVRAAVAAEREAAALGEDHA